jgi:hypothetical protein
VLRRLPALTRAFASRIDDIRSDAALTFFGGALASANIVTFVQWKFHNGVPLMVGRGRDSLCWPFWEGCHAYALPVAIVNAGLWLYLLLAVVAAGCFLSRRVSAGYWLLLLVNVMRVFVMLQDYRLKANHHYMLNWMVLAYLFLPHTRAMLRHVLVCIYFWAGALKLDPDWLSGAALYSQDRLWFPRALVPAACVYVVVLEMGMIWGLYSRRAWVFWGTLAQLALFHYTSWPIVGFWYPSLMLCLLSILPLARIIPAPQAETAARRRPHMVYALTAAVAVIFASLQMLPRAFPGDTAITGEGRMFALHMFDALVECDAALTYHLPDGDRVQVRGETTKLPHRSRCDPFVYYAIARNECARLAGEAAPSAAPVDFDVSLRSRRNSAASYTQVLAIRNFCAAAPHYALWHHNDWIGFPGDTGLRAGGAQPAIQTVRR